MKRLLSSAALFLALVLGSPAQAAGQRPADMTASGAIVGTQIVWCPIGTSSDLKCTFTQIDTFINAQFSGDFTVNGTGTATLKNTGPGATGPLGSATVAPIVTIDAQGRVTALSSATVTPAVGSITGLGTGVGTALGTNVGTAGAFVTFNGALGTPSSGTLTNATGLPLAGVTGWGTGVVAAAAAALNSNTGFIGALTPTNNNCVVGNGAAWTSAACPGGGSSTITAGSTATSGFTNGHFVQSNGSVVQDATAVTSVTAGCGTSTGGSAITTTGTVAAAITTRVNSTTSDTIVSTDCGNLVQENNASSIAVAIAQAGTAGFANGAFFPVCNKGAGTATITPATSTIGGASTYALPGGTAAAPVCITIVSDGTNYNVIPDWMANASLFTAGTVPIARLPTGTSGGNLPLMNGNNTWSATQTFGATVGTVTTQSGTTYTLASTDCGTTVRFTNASAVTVTIPQGLAVGCVIAIEQAAAGAVSVNGSAVTPATLHSAHSYTKTSAQWAVIGIFTESSNVAILTGDGA